MSNSEEKYQHLTKLSRHNQTLASIESLLHWDQETYMPPKGAEFRAEQIELLSGDVHDLKVSDKMRQAIDALIDIETGEIKAKDLSAEKQAALERWRRDYRIESALPTAFVKELAAACSKAAETWKSARKDNKFSDFAPHLQKLIDLCKRKAKYLGYTETPYDALLDLYEPGMKTRDVDAIFKALRDPIVKLLKKVVSQKQVQDDFLCVKYDAEQQKKIGQVVLDSMHYELDKGNVSITTHPFCSSFHPFDTRITTRIQENDVMSNIKVLLHEGGHALYAMQLPVEEFGTPLGDAISMGMHESQSRWWECYIGLGRPYCDYFFPLMQQQFTEQLKNVTVDQFWRGANKVEPSFIRVEADELTYPLHVILRFEIEKDLIEGKLQVKDIPQVWNVKMQELLGITPPNDTLGCLQDVHWAWASFGYFPTYLLGNAFAAFLFETFHKQNPDANKRIAKGDLLFVKEWLKENVHRYGRQYNSLELLEKVAGKPFSVEPYVRYLEDKYSKVYSLVD